MNENAGYASLTGSPSAASGKTDSSSYFGAMKEKAGEGFAYSS